jgi:predicted amidohydrolase
MKIGYLQYRPEFGEVEKNLDRVEWMLESCNADLIVLPELFNTGYVFTSPDEARVLAEEIPGGKTVERLSAIARRKKLHIVAGLAEKCDSRIFNSAALITPEGLGGRYRKIHLYSEEKLWFTPGDQSFEVYDIGVCRIGIMICFDWFFPESMRALALMGADVICHPANLVLPFCQSAMVTRCLENRVFAITANRIGTEDRGNGKSLSFTGKSQITGVNGTVLRSGSETDEEIWTVAIDISQSRDKRLNPLNDLFEDRRPEYYGRLTDSKIR